VEETARLKFLVLGRTAWVLDFSTLARLPMVSVTTEHAWLTKGCTLTSARDFELSVLPCFEKHHPSEFCPANGVKLAREGGGVNVLVFPSPITRCFSVLYSPTDFLKYNKEEKKAQE
jgi:hypothetical protein